MTMKTYQLMLSAAAVSIWAAACGGGQKTGSGLAKGADVPPPPPSHGGGEATPGKEAPKREISKDARADYDGAVASFMNNDKGGSWSEGACRASADKFSSVVSSHPDLVEAQYMVGLSLQRCNLMSDAEAAYQKVLHMNAPAARTGQALSNLGEIYYMAGKLDGARKYWDSAVAANGKLVAARNNIASMELDQMRKLPGCHCDKDPAWKKLEEDARFNLSNVLGVDSDNVKAYTLYGLVYMEGWEKNKNRLDLAKLLLDEADKRNPKFAPLKNAQGLLFMHKNSLSLALQDFQAAAEMDPKFAEARMNVGLTTLGFRKYDTAKDEFTQVIALQPKNYDAYIGLGIAMRGLNDFDGAEAQYKKALQIDPKRGEAYFNLGVLYQGFRANKQTDLRASQQSYRTARDYFKQFLDKDAAPDDKNDAKNNIADCEKVIAQLDDFIKNQASQPPPPATPPAAPAGTPAAPPAGAPPAAGAAPAAAPGK
jgi:tetratricopeptide (TPR) repeat protein